MFDRVLESKTAHASIILHNRNKMNSYILIGKRIRYSNQNENKN